MRVNQDEFYNDTITILNKLDARDASLSEDVYYKTILTGCMWSEQSTRTVGSDGDVQIGTIFKIQIPEYSDYLPYKDWSKAENRDDHFTVSMGDYVIRGEVTEDITTNTLKNIVRLYEPNACQVQHFRDLTDDNGITHALGGFRDFIEVLYVEGA